MMDLKQIEGRRQQVQRQLDAAKTQLARNKLGQFATPPALAADIVAHAVHLHGSAPVRFLEPSIGTGSFFSALLAQIGAGQLDRALGFEVDPHYGVPAQELWAETALEVRLASFTAAAAPVAETDKCTLLVSNPPYIRHHHLEAQEKLRLQQASAKAAGVQLGGLAGLYCHFMTLCHPWMAQDCVAAWLVPSEFMDVNYGGKLKEYLLDKVTLLRIHRFDPNDVQFGDALVSSSVVWLRNALPPRDHQVNFTFGGTHAAPKVTRAIDIDMLRAQGKWTQFPQSAGRPVNVGRKLGDFFAVKRGIATGGNNFFIVSESDAARHKLPVKYLRPILPSPRYVTSAIITADTNGIPLIERRQFLIDCRLPEDRLAASEPNLWAYFATGKATVASGYLCSKRAPWYAQEERAAAPIVCTYMGRGRHAEARPIRFFRNHSLATAANVWLLLYPKPALARALLVEPALMDRIWTWLDGINTAELLGEGRVYGGGLYKMEPRELANVGAEWLGGELAGGATDAQLGLGLG